MQARYRQARMCREVDNILILIEGSLSMKAQRLTPWQNAMERTVQSEHFALSRKA
jgi:hypothetical protein